MSDGAILLASAFALALIYSGTRIIVALLRRRPAESARLVELERRLEQVTQQLEQLQAATELTERGLGQLADAQRFTESLLRAPHHELASAEAPGRQAPGQRRDAAT